jgi:hypothetical protein
MWIFRFEGKLG